MAVIPLTLAISLCLVFTFVVFFWCEQARGRTGGAERDSLLPLAEETPRLVTADHEHGSPDCACARGERPPCAGCLRQTTPAVTPAL